MRYYYFLCFTDEHLRLRDFKHILKIYKNKHLHFKFQSDFLLQKFIIFSEYLLSTQRAVLFTIQPLGWLHFLISPVEGDLTQQPPDFVLKSPVQPNDHLIILPKDLSEWHAVSEPLLAQTIQFVGETSG